MSARCQVCGVRKNGWSDYCRTHKFAIKRAIKRVTEEKLIVDLAGKSWWIWDSKGEVLVIGRNTRPLALAALDAGDRGDE